MLVGMAVRDQPAAPLGLGEVIGRSRFDESVGQNPLKGLARDIAGRERAVEGMGGFATNRLDVDGFERRAIERPPRGRLFVA